jgi:hypothetical protein
MRFYGVYTGAPLAKEEGSEMATKLKLSYNVRAKLTGKTPPVSENDIFECFQNLSRTPIRDLREKHDSDPPTQWFISENDYGRRLKVCFIDDGENFIIRTAYVPNEDEERVFQAISKPL